MISLDDAIARFQSSHDPAADAVADSQRTEVLDRFPLSSWPEMTLEAYAIGQGDKDTFSFWLEFKTPLLGSMAGGSAWKLLIYKKKDGTWYFDHNRYGSVEEAWLALRSGFVEAFEAAQRGDWTHVDAISALDGAAALRTKALHVYFPDDVLPIYSKTYLLHFLTLLGESREDIAGGERMFLNRRLLELLRRRPALRQWSTRLLGALLYQWADPRESKQVVKIAPGENAKLWDSCLPGGYIAVGWPAVGDLLAFAGNKEDFRARFAAEYSAMYNGAQGAISKKANEVWRLTELEPGDLVVANRGTSHVLAVGEVLDPPYEFRPELGEYPHTVRLKWDTSYDQDIAPQKRWALVTVDKVTPELYAQIIGRRAGDAPARIPVAVDPRFIELADELERKGQVILYGPPGTGKTYTTRRFVTWWLARRSGHDDPMAVLSSPEAMTAAEESSKNVAEGVAPLTWLTFHPSYSYEEFIEGYRPRVGADGVMSVQHESGVFVRVCRAAAASPAKTFVVVIDEINRANVAKVFGELITLLEKDKRGMTVMLPQSRESFAIPPNVFVIGTMNTADRSVKLLDVALRRRFGFVELMPDKEALGETMIGRLSLSDLLVTLNRRISRMIGREKQIGHAVLMNGGVAIGDQDAFVRAFRHDILPLLQEYCYEDYDRLAQLIGETIVDRDRQTLNLEIVMDGERLIDALATSMDSPDAG